MSTVFTLGFWGGIENWYNIRVIEGKTDDDLKIEAEEKKAIKDAKMLEKAEKEKRIRQPQRIRGKARLNFFGIDSYDSFFSF